MRTWLFGAIVAALLASTLAVNPAQAAPTPITDNYGYKFESSDMPGGPGYIWSDISTATGVRDMGSIPFYMYGSADLGFSFPFYGQNRGSVFVHPMGFLTFDSGCYYCYYASGGLSMGTGIIAPWHTYMSVSAGACSSKIYTLTSGEAPNRIFTVQWTNFREYCSTSLSSSTYQVRLHETSGVIDFEYNKVGALYSSSYGVEAGLRSLNGCTTLVGHYARDGLSPAMTSKAFRFTPPDPSSLPRTTPDTLTVFEDTPWTALSNRVDLVANDIVAPSSYLSGAFTGAGGVGLPLYGSATQITSRVMAYQPSPNTNTAATGPDAVGYQVFVPPPCLYVKGFARVTIIPVNDAPSFSAVLNPTYPLGPGGRRLDQEDAGTVVLPAVIKTVLPGPAVTGTAPPGFDAEFDQTLTFTATLQNAADSVYFAPGGLPKVTITTAPRYDPDDRTYTAGEASLGYTVLPDVCKSSVIPVRITAKDNGGTANAGSDTSLVRTINLRLTCTPDPPTTKPDVYTVSINSAATRLEVLTNDKDIDGDTLSVGTVGRPDKFGTATRSSDGKAIQYTPHTGFSGLETFTYTAKDSSLSALEAQGKVTVHVVCPGVFANADVYTMAEDGRLEVPAATGLWANDDVAAVTSWAIESDAGHGHATALAGGAFRYVPAANFAGLDSFTYRLKGAGACTDVGTVEVRVGDLPDAPPVADDSFVVEEDSAENRFLVLDNDNGLARDGSATSDVQGPRFLEVTGITQPQHGTARLSFGTIYYTPEADYTGTDNLEYVVSDRVLDAVGKVTITVVNLPDAPIARPDHFDLPAEQESFILLDDSILRNDFAEIEGHSVPEMVAPPNHGRLLLATDGTFHFIPDPGFRGEDIWTYRLVSDNGTSDVVQVTLDIRPIQAPKADYHATRRYGVANLPMTFLDASNDIDGQVVAWEWDFNDGTSSLDRDPVHTFLKAGKYDVRLTVKDNDGLYGLHTDSILVKALPDPEDEANLLLPVADAGKDIIVDEGSFVQLDGTDRDGANATRYAWDQVLGTPVVIAGADSGRPTFRAPSVPADKLTLQLAFTEQVYNGKRQSLPDLVNVTVRPAPGKPFAYVGEALKVQGGQPVLLTGDAGGFRRGDDLAVAWSQVGGTELPVTVDGRSLTFTAPEGPETLVFHFAATAGELSASQDITVDVVPAPLGNGFTYRASPVTPLAVSFQPDVETSVRWDFGDGSNSREVAPNHTYAQAGTYRVVMERAVDGGVERTVEDIHVAASPGKDSKLAPGAGLLVAGLAVLAAASWGRRHS